MRCAPFRPCLQGARHGRAMMMRRRRSGARSRSSRPGREPFSSRSSSGLAWRKEAANALNPTELLLEHAHQQQNDQDDDYQSEAAATVIPRAVKRTAADAAKTAK